MENNTKTQIQKLVAEMAKKHDYLQTLESTSNSSKELSIDCLIRIDICKLYNIRVAPYSFLENLARLELNLLLLHKSFIYDCEREYENVLRDIVERVAFEKKISLED